jgi:hypothetical protein
LNEEKKAKWERLWHFLSVSQKFGKWSFEQKYASENERDLIIDIQKILTKYGVMDNPKLLIDVFDWFSESEKTTCLSALEVLIKCIKYHPHG